MVFLCLQRSGSPMELSALGLLILSCVLSVVSAGPTLKK